MTDNSACQREPDLGITSEPNIYKRACILHSHCVYCSIYVQTYMTEYCYNNEVKQQFIKLHSNYLELFCNHFYRENSKC